jgi:hypothetical protein
MLTMDHFFMMLRPVVVKVLRAIWSSFLRVIKSGLLSYEGGVDNSHFILRLLGILLSVCSLLAHSFFCSMTEVKFRQVEPNSLIWFSKAVCCDRMTVHTGSSSWGRLICRTESLGACLVFSRKGLDSLLLVLIFAVLVSLWLCRICDLNVLLSGIF